MDPISLYRLLRRRWVVLVVGAALGAVVGYASTLFVDDAPEGPVTLHWEAAQVLVVDPAATDFNLGRVGPEIAFGVIPATVAEARGVEPAELGIRVVTDGNAGTITISAVSAGDSAAAADAREISLAVAQLYLDSLLAEDLEEYQDQVAVLQAEINEQDGLYEQADRVVDRLRNQAESLPEGETLTAAQQDELDRASTQRVQAETARANAALLLEDLVRQGEPEAPIELVQEIAPSGISGAEYRGRINQAARAQNSFNNLTAVTEAAEDPSTSQQLESPILRALLGGVVGAILAAFGIVGHARLDTRLRTKAAFEAAFDLPVIAEVPVMKRGERRENILHSLAQPYSQIAESHRYIRSVLLFARAVPLPESVPAAAASGDNEGHDVRVIMVTSANPAEGKTTTAANLAVMMAEAGYDTVLINCDHRRPRMHELFNVPYAPGTVTSTALPDLNLVTDVIRDDTETPAKLGERQRTVVRNARREVDVVILDTAPILSTNDALDLLSVTDLVIIVAREGTTTVASAGEARELLIERMGVPVAGVVVTGATSGFGDRYYDRGRYGAYYGPDPAKSDHEADAGPRSPSPDPALEATDRTGTFFGSSAAPSTDADGPDGTDNVPTDEVPTDEVPTDEVPTDEVPTDEVPASVAAPDLGVRRTDVEEPEWLESLARSVDLQAPADSIDVDKQVIDLRTSKVTKTSNRRSRPR